MRPRPATPARVPRGLGLGGAAWRRQHALPSPCDARSAGSRSRHRTEPRPLPPSQRPRPTLQQPWHLRGILRPQFRPRGSRCSSQYGCMGGRRRQGRPLLRQVAGRPGRCSAPPAGRLAAAGWRGCRRSGWCWTSRAGSASEWQSFKLLTGRTSCTVCSTSNSDASRSRSRAIASRSERSSSSSKCRSSRLGSPQHGCLLGPQQQHLQPSRRIQSLRLLCCPQGW